MPHLRLISTLAALLLTATAAPVSAGTLAFVDTYAARGAETLSGTSLGAFTGYPTYMAFKNTLIGSTDPAAPVIFPYQSRLALPLGFFNHTLPDGSYSINPTATPSPGTTVINTPLFSSFYLPDPRDSSAGGTIPFTTPRFDLPDVSANLTVSPDPTSGLRVIRYTGSAAGTDYLTGTLNTLTISGVVAEQIDHTWTNSASIAFRNQSNGLLITSKITGYDALVPEPSSVLLLATGVASLAASRLRQRGKTRYSAMS